MLFAFVYSSGLIFYSCIQGLLIMYKINVPQGLQLVNTNREDSDQTVHLQSLILSLLCL